MRTIKTAEIIAPCANRSNIMACEYDISRQYGSANMNRNVMFAWGGVDASKQSRQLAVIETVHIIIISIRRPPNAASPLANQKTRIRRYANVQHLWSIYISPGIGSIIKSARNDRKWYGHDMRSHPHRMGGADVFCLSSCNHHLDYKFQKDLSTQFIRSRGRLIGLQNNGSQCVSSSTISRCPAAQTLNCLFYPFSFATKLIIKCRLFTLFVTRWLMSDGWKESRRSRPRPHNWSSRAGMVQMNALPLVSRSQWPNESEAI